MPAAENPPRLSDGVGLAPDEVELGSIQGVFGVRGELRLFLHNPESDMLARPRELVLIRPDGQRWSGYLTARSGAGRRVIGRLRGVDDPDVAASWIGTRLAIARSAFPPPGKGEYYVADLIGCDVFVGEERVGSVRDVHTTPGGDLLEIATGDTSEFVPFLRELLAEVDIDARLVRLTERTWD